MKLVKTFSSAEERTEYLKERIETGKVVDLLWHTESGQGGEHGPVNQEVEDQLNGRA